MKNKKIKSLLLLPVLVGILSACDSGSSPAPLSGGSASASNSGAPTYTVVSEMNYIPFMMHDGNGHTSGFEYDLLQAIAEKQGIQFKYTPHLWDELFNLLQRKEVDIISSGVTITPERQQKVSFSKSYLTTETSMLTEDKSIVSYANLKGKNVSIQDGTLHNDIVNKHHRESGKLVAEKSTYAAVNSVLKRNTDVALGDKLVLQYYKKQNAGRDLHVVDDPSAIKEQLGWAVNKDNTELLNHLNAGLQKIKDDGTYENIYRKWFN